MDPSPNKFLYEIFTKEEVNEHPKIVNQVMDFEYGICFSECLVGEDDLTIDEAHELAVIDSDLKFEGEKPISECPIIEIDVEDEKDD